MNKLSKEVEKIWTYHHKDKKQVLDPFGIKIKKIEYNTTSSFTWTIDHIYPLKPVKEKSKNASDDIKNKMPVSKVANKKKGHKTKNIKINNQIFSIKSKTEINGKIVGRVEKKS